MDNGINTVTQNEKPLRTKKYSEFWLVSILKFIAYVVLYFTVTIVLTLLYEFFAAFFMSFLNVGNMNVQEIERLVLDHMNQVGNYIAFAGALVTLVILVVFFLIRRKNPIKQMGLVPKKAALLPVAFVTGVSLNMVLSVLFSLLPEKLLENYGESMGDMGPFAGYLLAAVIAAPIIEEIIFRGLGISRLKRSMPMPVALIISTLFFGLAHFGGHWLQVIYTGVFGLILGLLYCYTESIWLSIALHLGFNLYSLMGFINIEKMPEKLAYAFLLVMDIFAYLSIPIAVIGVTLLLILTKESVIPAKYMVGSVPVAQSNVRTAPAQIQEGDENGTQIKEENNENENSENGE